MDPRVGHPVASGTRGSFQFSSFAGRLDGEQGVWGEHVEAAVFRVFIERGFQSAHLEAREHEPRVVVAVAFPRLVVLLGATMDGEFRWANL